MEWSRVPGNQKKREKKEEEESTSPAFSRSLRFIFGKLPSPYSRRREKSRTVCMQSMLLGNA